MKRAAILQPSYLPWLGFFEQAHRCDVFVFLDDVQFTKNDWRNRNRIKTKNGVQWLTVPVSFKFGQKINEVLIDNSRAWHKKHFQSLKTWYAKSGAFNLYSEELKQILYKTRSRLVDLNMELTLWLMEKIGLKPEIVLSSALAVDTRDRQLRLIDICRALNCDFFYEGKSGRNYIDEKLFASHGITVEFQDYHHPYYNQLWLKEQGFISHLSIIDLLFNHGSDSLPILSGEKVVIRPEEVPPGDPDA